jgi:hypothetical protein
VSPLTLGGQRIVRIPVQIVRQVRRLIYRVPGWNRWLDVFFRGWDALIVLRC